MASTRSSLAIRKIQADVAALVPPAAARDIRVSPPEQRQNWMRVRVAGVDALDIGELCKRCDNNNK